MTRRTQLLHLLGCFSLLLSELLLFSQVARALDAEMTLSDQQVLAIWEGLVEGSTIAELVRAEAPEVPAYLVQATHDRVTTGGADGGLTDERQYLPGSCSGRGYPDDPRFCFDNCPMVLLDNGQAVQSRCQREVCRCFVPSRNEICSGAVANESDCKQRFCEQKTGTKGAPTVCGAKKVFDSFGNATITCGCRTGKDECSSARSPQCKGGVCEVSGGECVPKDGQSSPSCACGNTCALNDAGLCVGTCTDGAGCVPVRDPDGLVRRCGCMCKLVTKVVSGKEPRDNKPIPARVPIPAPLAPLIPKDGIPTVDEIGSPTCKTLEQQCREELEKEQCADGEIKWPNQYSVCFATVKDGHQQRSVACVARCCPKPRPAEER